MNDNKIRQIIPIIADSNGWIWINNSYSTSQHCQLNEHHDMFLPFFGAVFWSPILAKELIKLGIQAIGESTQWLLCANITCLSFWSVLPSAQMRLGLKMDKKKTSKKKSLPSKCQFSNGKNDTPSTFGIFSDRARSRWEKRSGLMGIHVPIKDDPQNKWRNAEALMRCKICI